jgi:hypothetical protein
MELDGMGQLTYYLYSADIYHFCFSKHDHCMAVGLDDRINTGGLVKSEIEDFIK